MSRRGCSVHQLLPVHSQDDVISRIKELNEKCKEAPASGGKRLSLRVSRPYYHSASDLLCPEHPAGGQVPSGCSVMLDTQHMNHVLEINSDKQYARVQPAVLLDKLLNELEHRGQTLDYGHLPFYCNLTVAGSLLTAAHGSNNSHPAAFGYLVQSTTWVDARGDVHTASGQNQVKQLIGSVGLFGVVTELTVSTRPLIKMKAQTYRIMHQEQMLSQLDALMSEPSTAVIQWVPDSRQAFVTSRWEVPPDTWGTAQFSVFNNKPLISRLAGPTIGLQQVDNAQLNPFDWRAGTRLLDDLPICLASAVLLPFYQLKPHPFTQVPVLTEALTHPVVGRVSDMACSNCAPNDRGCVWRGAYTTLLELDFDASRLREWMGDVQKIYDAGVRLKTCTNSVLGFAVRFSGPAPAPLDMDSGRGSVNVDIVINKAPALADAPAPYQDVMDEIEQLTLCKYGARPHWGKNSNRAFRGPPGCPLPPKYGSALSDVVATAAALYDPDGVFVTPVLQEALGSRAVARPPGCASRAECYCQQDADCSYGHRCVPGAVFGEYLVCKPA